MTFPEISLLALAAIALLYRAWSGWRHGATMEMRYTLAFLFGTLVATRFWQPSAQMLASSVTFDPRLVAVIAFIVLFAVATGVAAFVVNLRAKAYQSVKANYVDKLLGLAAGIFSGVLLAACILWSATIAMPGKFEAIPQVQSLVDLPRQLVGSLESFSGMAADSTGRTLYPVATMVDVQVDSASADVPAGTVLMQRRGKVDWK